MHRSQQYTQHIFDTSECFTNTNPIPSATNGKHDNSSKKTYSTQDLCPFPFEKGLHMSPFLHGYVIPNLPKYNGKHNPLEHIREFFKMCIDVAYDPTYLMRLFPWSLNGIALEWFSKLPYGIRSWGELAEKFVEHFSFNIDNEITIATLCHTTQDEGENLSPSSRDGEV